jgi:hypothetical protein
MHDCTITPENSDCTVADGNCGSPIVARVFFIVFIIVGQFMLLNLFIAVILDAFGSSEEDDDNCTEDDYEQFQQQWQRLDPEATVSLRSFKCCSFQCALTVVFSFSSFRAGYKLAKFAY